MATGGVVGEGVIKVTADASGVAGAMAAVRAEAKKTGDAVGQAMSAGSKNAAKGIDSYIAKIQQSADAVGKSAREVKLLELANRGATAAQLQAADAALRTIEAARQQAAAQRQAAQAAQAAAAAQTAAATAAGKGTSGYFQLAAGQKLSAYQAQQLSFQLNDLFVQIASGQSPITALIQQGSQLNGQFGGLGGTMRALGQAFTLTRVAIGGIVGAIAAVAFSVIKGTQESADFAKALTLTGNAAGITEGQFNAAAQAISASTKTTIGSTRETLQALVASGKLSGTALEGAARATQGLARVTGQETSKIADQFVQLTGNVAKGAEELNNQYNFLTASQLRYIKTLEDQGDSQKALTILFDALNGRIDSASQNLGTLEKGWQAVKNAASSAIDAMLRIGRTTTPGDAIGEIETKLRLLSVKENLFNRGATAEKRAELTQQLDALKETERLQNRSAASQAQSVERERAKTDFFKLQDQVLSRSEQREKEIAKAKALALKSGASEVELAKVLANINEKYKDPKGPKGPKPRDTERQDARAALLLQIEDIKSTSEAIVEAFANQERILEAKKSASLISDQQYYAEKNNLIEQQAQFQIDKLRAVNAELEKQTFKGADAKKDELDRDREVLKNQREIAKIRASTATQAEVLSIQEQDAYKKIANAILEARAAAQSYFDVIQRGYDQEIANIGKGDRQRSFDQAKLQITEKYEAQRQQLAADLRRGQLTRQQYDAELATINEFQGKAIESYKKYYDKLNDLQSDWRNGATEALQNYVDETKDVAKQTEEAFTNAFKAMEDGIVEFSTTGKLSFKSFANAILQDWARMNAKQITGPIAQALQGNISGSGNSGGGFFGALFGSLFKGGSSGGTRLMDTGSYGTSLGSYASGIDFVPYDMIAQIHKGERVVPASENNGKSAQSQTIVINPPAGMTRQTSNQFAADVARNLRMADSRNN